MTVVDPPTSPSTTSDPSSSDISSDISSDVSSDGSSVSHLPLPTDVAADISVRTVPDTAESGPAGEVVVGLIADPGLASDLVARDLAHALADTTGRPQWRVETARGPVGLDSEGLLPMLRRGPLRERHG